MLHLHALATHSVPHASITHFDYIMVGLCAKRTHSLMRVRPFGNTEMPRRCAEMSDGRAPVSTVSCKPVRQPIDSQRRMCSHAGANKRSGKELERSKRPGLKTQPRSDPTSWAGVLYTACVLCTCVLYNVLCVFIGGFSTAYVCARACVCVCVCVCALLCALLIWLVFYTACVLCTFIGGFSTAYVCARVCVCALLRAL